MVYNPFSSADVPEESLLYLGSEPRRSYPEDQTSRVDRIHDLVMDIRKRVYSPQSAPFYPEE